MTFSCRLVAYEPAGARIGVLPSPLQASAGFVHDDVGALTASYSRLALRGEVLDRALSTGLEIAVEVTARDGSWVEPRGGRFVWLARQDDIADAAQVVKVTAPSYGWLLSKAAMLDLDHLLPEDHSQAGKRPFYSASAGTILATLLQENAARSGVPVSAGFTSSADSAGAAWSQVVTLYYEPGIDYRRVLTNLADQGMCDWRTEGRTLRVWNPDTVCAVDRSESVRLTLGLDLAEAPSDESLEEVAGRVLLRGDAGMALTLDNPEAPTPWGTWEAYLSQGGVSDEGTARTLVQAELDRRARTRQQYTRALVLPGSDVWPLVDYAPGDWITAPTSVPAERVRVQQVTLTMDAQGVGGSVVLNDRVLDAEIRRSRRMTGIVGGSAADGGSGARPAPQGPDKRTPAAPLGLVVDSDAYIDTDGAARGTLDAAWSAVVTATDGTALEVASYDVAMRENTVGAPWAVRRSTDDTQTVIGGLPVGQTYQVKVRARGRFTTTPGVWSAPVTVTVADDVTPPAVPSTPTASVDRGVVRVAWDGKTSAGGTMPRDFARVEIASDAAPTVPVGTVLAAGGGFILVTGLAYGEPVRYRARAVDRSGNASTWSPWSNVVTPVPLVSEDIDATITAAIDANRADLDQIGPTLDQAVTDLADARDRLDVAEDLVSDAITIADGANDTSADALTRAHAAQEAADQANAAASAAVQGAGNVLGVNWSFEAGDLSDWRTVGAGLSVVAVSDAVHGAMVAQWSATGGTVSIDSSTPTTQPATVAAPGQAWLARFRVRTVGAGPAARVTVRVQSYNGSAWVNAASSATVTPGTTWQAIEVEGVMPAGALGVRAYLYGNSADAAGAVLQIDAAELRDWTQVKAALAAAATAQAEAEAAHQAAGLAQDIADAALTAATGAAKILHSTAAPSGTAPAGSTWWRHTADGGVIGQWEQTAAPSGGTWVERPIRSEVIANLDVGKLTAGTSVVVEQVAQKIAASTAAFQRADIGNLFVTGETVLDVAVAQEFWARKIGAQKVLANEVIIGGASNAIPDSNFSTEQRRDFATYGTNITGAWAVSSATNTIRWGGSGQQTAESKQFYFYAAPPTSDYDTAAMYPVTEGQTWQMSGLAFVAYGLVRWIYRYVMADGSANAATIPGHSYQSSSASEPLVASLTIPPGVTHILPVLQFDAAATTAWVYAGASLTRKIDTALIVDGAVRARHVGAEEIEGYHVKANTLTADRAVLGFLDGYVITGALIQTLAAANRGVKLSETGLWAYNTSGQVTVQIDGATATITGGTMRSSATPSATDGGWQLDTSAGLRFWASRSDGSIGQGARLYANGRAVFYKPDGSIGVQITDGTLSVANGMLVGAMLADGAITRAKIGDNAVGTVQIANGAVTADILAANAVTAAKIQANAINGMTITGATIQTDTSAVGSGSGLRINGTGANATLTVWSGSNDITINPGGGQPYIRWERGTSAQYSAYAATSNRWTLWDNRAGGQVITASRNAFWAQGATATSTASVNCRVGGSGDLYTVSSLRKDKLLIEDAPDAWADAALALRPRTWLDRASHDAYAEYLSGERAEPGDPVPLSTRIPGFVAEEVAEVAPDLCTYDDTGALTGVQYDRVPAALVVLAQRQQHQLDDLTARLTALETP